MCECVCGCVCVAPPSLCFKVTLTFVTDLYQRSVTTYKLLYLTYLLQFIQKRSWSDQINQPQGFISLSLILKIKKMRIY